LCWTDVGETSHGTEVEFGGCFGEHREDPTLGARDHGLNGMYKVHDCIIASYRAKMKRLFRWCWLLPVKPSRKSWAIGARGEGGGLPSWHLALHPFDEGFAFGGQASRARKAHRKLTEQP
jgi:hypothetical protein